MHQVWLEGSGMTNVEIFSWTRSEGDGGGSVVGVNLSGAFGPTKQSESSRVLRMAIAAASAWGSLPPLGFIVDMRDTLYSGGDMLLSSWEAIVPAARVAYVCNPQNLSFVQSLLDEQADEDQVRAFLSESDALDFLFASAS